MYLTSPETDRLLVVCHLLPFPVLPPVLLHSSGASGSRNGPDMPYAQRIPLWTSYVSRMVNTTTVSEVVVVAAGWKVIGGLRYEYFYAPRTLLSLESCVDLSVCLCGSFGYRLPKCCFMLADRHGVPGMFGTASQIVLRLLS